MESAQIVLIISMVLTGVASTASLYLLVQAIVDGVLLSRSGKNGALKSLSDSTIINESLRSVKLLLLATLLFMAMFLPDGSAILMRRILVVAVVALIAAGSLYGSHARRALINKVADELQSPLSFGDSFLRLEQKLDASRTEVLALQGEVLKLRELIEERPNKEDLIKIIADLRVQLREAVHDLEVN
jgi:hypothetical protein